jgi:AraC-like DNA-binding protein
MDLRMDLPSVTGGLRHQLGGYREHRPAPALARVAESLWTHRAAAATTPIEGGVHRVLPDPALNLAFRCSRGPDGWARQPRLVVIGPKTRPFLFRFLPGEEIAAVKVKLEWGRPLLNLDPSEHLDREDDVTHALTGGSSLLAELSATRSADEACAVLADRAIDGLRHRDANAPDAPSQALDLIRAMTGKVRVDMIARGIGISLRQLRRAVRAETAISLKAYARITRLNHAMLLADGAPRPSWARLAAESGFYDQPHLVRECRALAGLSPGQAHRERRAQAETSNHE